MKPFQALLFLVIGVLIGGTAALYWGKSVQDATMPIVVDEPTAAPVDAPVAVGDEPGEQPADEPVAPGGSVQPITDEPPSSTVLPIVLVEDYPDRQDQFSIVEDDAGQSVWVEGNTLFVNVGYGGGCQEHEFTAYWNGLWAESAPPKTGIRIIHDSNDDFCEAAIGPQTLRFDLSSLTRVYADFYFAVQGYEESVSTFVGSNYSAE